MNKTTEKHTYTYDLIQTHVGLAVELYLLAKIKFIPGMGHFQSNRYSISSIIHSIGSIESCAQVMHHKMFIDRESPLYISEEKRQSLLKEKLESWFYISLPEKVNIIFEEHKIQFNKTLVDKFNELNNLRNKLVHSYLYNYTKIETQFNSITYLTQYIRDNDWERYYPINGFKIIEEIDEEDAYKALIITFDILKLFDTIGCSIGLILFFPTTEVYLIDNDFEIEKLIENTNNIINKSFYF